MSRRSAQGHDITPELILRAYTMGIFPMAESADDPGLFWVEPEQRGIIPLDGFHLSKSLAKTVKSGGFTVKIDHDFPSVIDACAEPTPPRGQTWINARIRDLFTDLFAMGFCHTVEVYRGDQLVGGLYGLAIGGAFFGESMFHRARDASKVALVHLVARLKLGGFHLLDTQFVTDHLKSLGAIEIPRMAYRDKLDEALGIEADFHLTIRGGEVDADEAVALLRGQSDLSFDL